jgi:trans-aconitate 2-methyltransferase
MADWSPEKYLAFANERARPARDLIAQIPNRSPGLIYDLGCGPGNSTRLLREAFPVARIKAIDSSPAMIEKAQTTGVDADFSVVDVIDWVPNPNADLVFSNALFQWVPKHDQLLWRIFQALKPGAVLAIQMPDNLQEPSHSLMADAARGFVRGPDFDRVLNARSPLLSPTQYVDLLSPSGTHVNVWRTTYHHLLNGHGAIAEMFSSTGLKPWLDVLDPGSTDGFLHTYVQLIAPHYRESLEGTVVYPFPRLFILSIKA